MNITLIDKIKDAHSLSYNVKNDTYVKFKNFNELIKFRYKNNPDDIFIKFYNGNDKVTEYSYKEFIQKVNFISAFLLHNNITKESRVATFSENHIDTVIIYFACWMIGAVIVPVNIGEDKSRVRYILENSKCEIIFSRTEFIDKLYGTYNDNEILLFDLDNFDMKSSDEFPSTPYNIDSSCEAMIVYTSGTTGNPKGVILTQYNLMVDAHFISQWHNIKENDTMMCVLPIHHVNGTVVTLITPFYYGGKTILNKKFPGHTFFQLLEENKVKIVSVVPTLLQFLLHIYEDTKRFDLSSFSHFICGAGPLTSELAKNFEKKFALRIVHGYGLSETTCYSCFIPVNLSSDEHFYWQNDLGFPSIGIPIKCNEMEIHNIEGQPVDEKVRGEIVIRGHNVMKEYFNNDTANENAFTFGWFRSGDEGFFKRDSHGNKYFFITCRIKELIIRGGVNISPLEIDEILNSIECIESGIAVGFDNDWYGEEVGALVKLKKDFKGRENNLKDLILKETKSKLAFIKSPKVIIFTDEIPVTSTGKYKRNEAKKLFAEYKTIQFKK